MDGKVILSLLLGAGLASINILFSLTALRRLVGAASSDFLVGMFRGMLFRMAGVLAAFVAVLWLVPVDIPVFAVSFLSVVILGLVVEVVVATRSVRASK